MEPNYNYHYMMSNNELYFRAGYDAQQYGFIFSHSAVDNVDLIHIINGGFSSVAEAISNSGNTTLSDGIILALAGALSAFFFNLIQKGIDAKTKRLTKSGEAMLSLINELGDIAVRYWVRGHDSSCADNESNICDEINIKAMLMTLDKNIRFMVDNLPLKNKSLNKNKLEKFSSDIYDLASGEDFEAEVRPPNKTKAFAISKKCSEAKAIILGLI
ncbi:hypothetical protein FJC28_06795 [Escherichia coli]|nr:hypothetical protein [Escherichia coli]